MVVKGKATKPARGQGGKAKKGGEEQGAKKGEPAADDSKVAEKGKKEPKAKKKGKEWTWGQDDLEAELNCLGLRVKQVTGDGNCFFRSLCDQMEGSERNHPQLRQQVVDHMRDNEEAFAPFVEDDEPFARYLSRMKKDGCWAGYMELIAASNFLQANIHVHQPGQPRWVVGSYSGSTARTLHISYHDGQHYNSVRNAGDHSSGAPPEPIVLKPAVEGKGEAKAGGRGEGGAGWGEKEERRVCTSSGCSDRGLVRQALEEAGGDVDAALERVIEVLSSRVEEEAGAGDKGGGGEGEAGGVNCEAEEEAGKGEGRGNRGGSSCVKEAAREGGEDGGEGGRKLDGTAPSQPGRSCSEVEAAGGLDGGEEASASPAPSASALGPKAAVGGVGVGSRQEDADASCGPRVEMGIDPGIRPGGDNGGGQEADVRCVSQGVGSGTNLGLDPGADSGPESGADPGAGPGAGSNVGPSSGVASRQVTEVRKDDAGEESSNGSEGEEEEGGGRGPAAKTGDGAAPAAGPGGAKRAGQKAELKAARKGIRLEKKPSRNKDCSCGSRRKYKNCCGTAAAAGARRQAAAGSGDGKAAAAGKTAKADDKAVTATAAATPAAVAAASKHLATWHM